MTGTPTDPTLAAELANVGDAIAGPRASDTTQAAVAAATEQLEQAAARETDAEADAELEAEHQAAADIPAASTDRNISVLEAQGFSTLRSIVTQAAIGVGQPSVEAYDALIDRAGLALTQAKLAGDRNAEEAIFHDLRVFRATRRLRVELGKIDAGLEARRALLGG